MLKVTHLPIVGAIWLFELAHEQVRESNTFSSIQPPHHTAGPSILRIQAPLPNHTPTNTSHHQTIDSKATAEPAPGPIVENAKAKKEAERTNVVCDTDLQGQVKELSGHVKDLSAKIAELTALIMAQQPPAPQVDDDEDDEAA